IVYISSMGVSSFSIPVFLKILLTSSSQITLAMIGLSLLIGIPLLMLIYNGTKLIFGFRTKFRFIGLSSFSLWLTGLVLCGIVALQVTRSFSHKYVKTQTASLIQPIKNTLYLDLKPDNSIDSLKSYDEKFLLGQWNMVTANGKNIHFGVPNLEFIKSETDSFNLLIFYSARGENRDIAMQRANLIDYKFVQKDSVLLFNPYFYLPVKEKWRNQNVRILLKIPVGKGIFINKNMGILLNNPNSDSTNSELINKKWIMQEGGLKVPTYFAPVQAKVDSSKIDKKPILNKKIK
ncbi:MAG: hypothetical protein HXX09_12965, partial [Bacteroidetes bacterium]|nr:hypothetical protein [Bacteroidota bacterium]